MLELYHNFKREKVNIIQKLKEPCFRVKVGHYILIVLLTFNAFIFTENKISFYIQLFAVLAILIHHYDDYILTNKLNHLSYIDALTDLPNRTRFDQEANNLLDIAKRNHLSFYVIFLDLDGFKQVNDKLGHKIGDDVLKKVSNIIKNNFNRSNDIYCRMGGDEFIIFTIQKHSTDFEIFIQNILTKINKIKLDKNLKVSGSMGIVNIENPSKDLDLENLIQKADKLMYKVKNSTKNGYLIEKE